ncbi:hypothetical protein HDU67_004092, partial [Dinochytrium kinnereticum]
MDARIDDELRGARRTVLVTGATSGIGRVTETVQDIIAQTGCEASHVVGMRLDLASLHSVREFVGEVLGRGLEVGVVVLNAGCVGGSALGLTEDGVEVTFA